MYSPSLIRGSVVVPGLRLGVLESTDLLVLQSWERHSEDQEWVISLSRLVLAFTRGGI